MNDAPAAPSREGQSARRQCCSSTNASAPGDPIVCSVTPPFPPYRSSASPRSTHLLSSRIRSAGTRHARPDWRVARLASSRAGPFTLRGFRRALRAASPRRLADWTWAPECAPGADRSREKQDGTKILRADQFGRHMPCGAVPCRRRPAPHAKRGAPTLRPVELLARGSGSIARTARTAFGSCGGGCAKSPYGRARPAGYFWPLAEAAVRRFRTVNGLAVDGVVGPRTRSTLG